MPSELDRLNPSSGSGKGGIGGSCGWRQRREAQIMFAPNLLLHDATYMPEGCVPTALGYPATMHPRSYRYYRPWLHMNYMNSIPSPTTTRSFSCSIGPSMELKLVILVHLGLLMAPFNPCSPCLCASHATCIVIPQHDC